MAQCQKLIKTQLKQFFYHKTISMLVLVDSQGHGDFIFRFTENFISSFWRDSFHAVDQLSIGTGASWIAQSLERFAQDWEILGSVPVVMLGAYCKNELHT